MALTAHDENKLTLTSILGLAEEEAETLLSETILITYDDSNQIASKLTHHLEKILSRTFANITTKLSDEISCEIVIGNIPERTQCIHTFVRFGDFGKLVISQNKPTKESRVFELHEAFQIVTACYIVAFTMRQFLGSSIKLLPSPAEINIDFEVLFPNMDFLEKQTDIGKVYLAGAGAIGNAFLYTLQTFKLAGQIFVCDADKVSDGNLNRCLWFDASEVGNNKAGVLARVAQPQFSKIVLTPHEGTLSSIPQKAKGGAWLDRLVVAVDSRRARRSLNSEIPHETFDASTTDIQEAFFHFNKRPLSNLACLECAYPVDTLEKVHEHHVAEFLGVALSDIEQLTISSSAATRICSKYTQYKPGDLEGQSYDTLFKELCGKGTIISKSESHVLAPFAFISVLAGAILAIEFVQRISTGIHTYNSFRLSPWSSPVLALRQQIVKNSNCSFCANPTKLAFSERLWQTK